MPKLRVLPLVVILARVVTGTALAGSSSATLSNGANLSVSLDSPLTSTEYLIASGETGRDVTVTGTASIGQGNPDVTLIYVVDLSGSTELSGGCGVGDVNGDGNSDSILDCEVAALISYTNTAASGGSVDEFGIAVYASEGATADMQPAGGSQLFTGSASDVNTVLASMDGGGGVTNVDEFSDVSVGEFTDFSAGLADTQTLVNNASNTYKFVLFLSDGKSNENEGNAFSSRAATLAASSNTQVFTFAIGSGSSCTEDDHPNDPNTGTLAEIGPCTVTTAANLQAALPDLISTTLDEVRLSVDGIDQGAVATVPATPVAGPQAVTWSFVAQDLAPGDHVLCATATGHAEAPSNSPVTTDPTCETIHVYQLSASPENEVNELGTPGQTHTVTGTLAGPLGGLAPVGGRNLTFTILSGPNASTPPFVGVTDAAGNTDFTYTATQGNVGLGTDVIEVCVTLNTPLGETGCETVTKVWADTTPPEFTCTPTVNPDGRNTPRANDHNQDGFYLLTATDAVDDSPDIYVVDSGSGTVFGPFPSGTRIKYTEAPGGTPSQKPIGGPNSAVQWHITGTGDMQMYAVDFSGNVGDAITCLVPPPPR